MPTFTLENLVEECVYFWTSQTRDIGNSTIYYWGPISKLAGWNAHLDRCEQAYRIRQILRSRK